MRRAAVVGLVLGIVGAAAGGAYVALRAGGVPKGNVVVTPDPIEFGEAALGTFTEREATIENRGKESVLLRDPTFDCPCFFLLSRPLSSLRPREKTTFRIGMDPSKAGDARRFRKTMTVITSDPTAPRVEVPVVGEVVHKYAVDREAIAFGAVDAAKGDAPQRFVLRSGPGWQVRVDDAFSTDARFDVQAVAAEGGWDVVVTPKADAAAPKGKAEAQVHVALTVSGHDRPPKSEVRTLHLTADFR
jgi:hypothetical protein